MPPPLVERLSAFLRGHQDGARYEVAASNVTEGAGLIIRDARPVLTLTSFGHRQLVTPDRLARDAQRGNVRYVLSGARGCTRVHHRSTACEPALRWVKAHGVNVSYAVRLGHGRLLYRLPHA